MTNTEEKKKSLLANIKTLKLFQSTGKLSGYLPMLHAARLSTLLLFKLHNVIMIVKSYT